MQLPSFSAQPVFFPERRFAAEKRTENVLFFFANRISTAAIISHHFLVVACSCLHDSVLPRVRFALCAVDMFQPHARSCTV